MHWDQITKESTGIYICQAKNKETNQYETLEYYLCPVEPKNSTIIGSNFNNGAELKVELTQAFNLTCDFSGIPRPKLTWYKGENDAKKPLEFSDSDHKSLENDGKILRIKFTKDEDEGVYACEAKYGKNSEKRSVTIEISKIFLF